MDAISGLGRNSDALRRRDASRTRRSEGYRWLLTIVGMGVALLVLSVVFTVIARGVGMLNWTFITHAPENNMTEGGIAPIIAGSLYLLLGTLLVTLPIGILGGIFLAEYAGTKRWVGTAKSLITSLAGTPSIVYGLFGYATFVLLTTRSFSLTAGILTLAAMAIPIVVLSTETAIKSVPQSQIDGAYALGMTRWQTIWKVVLPQAVPGIMTGLMLATGRAMGEAPPILLTAGVFFATLQPRGLEIFTNPVQNLPYHLTEIIKQQANFTEQQVWGTCLVLLLFMLSINLFAILIRARQRRAKSH